MKGKKYKKKIISNYIIILFFIILFLIATLIIFNFNSEEKYVQDKFAYINSDEWKDEIYPEGMPKFFRSYNGKLTAQKIGKSISFVANEVLPKYYNRFYNLENEEIIKYYNKNKKIIYLEIGEITEVDFLQLINTVKKFGKQDMQLESYYVDKETIMTKNGYTIADLYIKYKECEEFFVELQVLDELKVDSSSIKYNK